MRATAIAALAAATIMVLCSVEGTAATMIPPFLPQTSMPTPADPFIFLHLAKCAGTSLRALLYNMTKDSLGTEVCIPTYSHSFLVLSKKGCGYTTSPNSLKPSLMAGHFIWEEYEWMLQTAQNRGFKGDNIPCFTSIREPIERLVSLYYYVMDKWKRPVTVLLQDMEVPEVLAALNDIWPVMRQTPLLSHFGNFGGVPTYVGWRNGEWKKQPEVFTDDALKRAAADAAIKNLPRCVVGDMADELGSTELIQFFFPWMQFKDLPRLNTREGHTKGVADTAPLPTAPRTMKQRMHDPLQPHVRAALELHYKEEVEVYRVAKRVHEAQVAYVRSQDGWDARRLEPTQYLASTWIQNRMEKWQQLGNK